jgi:hypothetical protein
MGESNDGALATSNPNTRSLAYRLRNSDRDKDSNRDRERDRDWLRNRKQREGSKPLASPFESLSYTSDFLEEREGSEEGPSMSIDVLQSVAKRPGNAQGTPPRSSCGVQPSKSTPSRVADLEMLERSWAMDDHGDLTPYVGTKAALNPNATDEDVRKALEARSASYMKPGFDYDGIKATSLKTSSTSSSLPAPYTRKTKTKGPIGSVTGGPDDEGGGDRGREREKVKRRADPVAPTPPLEHASLLQRIRRSLASSFGPR